MVRAKPLMIGLVAALGMAVPADAHWQYTRWGMTRAQVLAAAPAGSKMYADRRLDTPDSQVLLLAPYSANGLGMAAAFGFSADGRLNKVMLLLFDPKRCSDLRMAMRDTYGWPDHNVDMSPAFASQDWRDTVAGNKVMFVRHGAAESATDCFVVYTPLPTGL